MPDNHGKIESSSAPEAAFVFDLTDIAPPPSEAAASWKYVMVAKDMASGLDLTVRSFALIDPLANASVSAASLPFTVDSDSGYAVVEYRISSTMARAAADRRSADRMRIERRDGGSAVILFGLAQPGGYRIEVTDLSGRLIRNHHAKIARHLDVPFSAVPNMFARQKPPGR